MTIEETKLLEDKTSQEVTVPPKFKNLLPWQYQVLVAKFNNPKASQTQLAKLLGTFQSNISLFLKTAKYKNALIEYGKERFFHLIPIALHNFEAILSSKNDNVRLNACIKVLEDSGVLSKETMTRIMNQINTQINVSALELRGKSIEELNEMLLNQLRNR